MSNYIPRKSKELVKEKGVLSLHGPKPGPSLPQETVDNVHAFYESDKISRVMPGKKDVVSVKKKWQALVCSKTTGSVQLTRSV